MGIRPLMLDVTEGTTNNTTVPTLGKVEDLIGVENLWDRVTGTPNYLIPNTAADDIGATLARITKIWVTDIESYNMPTVGGTSINANAVLDLTADEVTQLAAIGTTTISAGQWVYLGAMNQGVATTDTVAFADLTIDNININGDAIVSTANLDLGSSSGTGCTRIVDENGDPVFSYDNDTDIFRFSDSVCICVGNELQVNTINTFNAVAGVTIEDVELLNGAIKANSIAGLTDAILSITAYAGKGITLTGGDNDDILITAGLNGYVKMDNVRIYSSTIETTAGALSLIPVAGTYVIIDSHWGFDANALTSLTDNNTILNAYAGKNITIEGVIFDGGLLTADQLTVDSIVLNAAAITITENSTDFTFECKRLNPGDGNDLYIYGSNGVNAGAGADGGDIIISTRQGVAGGVDGEIYLQVGGVTKTSVTDNYFSSTGYVLQTGIFAEIYVADASTAQSIATGVTYTKSTAFTSNGQSANCTSDATNDKITITQIGRYRVSGSCSGTSGKANLTWRGAAFLNGAEQNQVHWKRKMTTTTDSGDMSFTGFIDVTSAPWDLDFRLRHDDGGNQNFTIEYANLNVEYMGAT